MWATIEKFRMNSRCMKKPNRSKAAAGKRMHQYIGASDRGAIGVGPTQMNVLPAFPKAGTPAGVHHRLDLSFVASNFVDHEVGKAGQLNSSQSFRNVLERVPEFFDAAKRCVELPEKFFAEPVTLAVIPFSRCKNVTLGEWRYCDRKAHGF
jgi:hypothetical protein